MAIKCVKVTMYKGKTLSSGFDTQIFLNDQSGQNIKPLQKWYNQNKANLQCNLLSEPSELKGEREDRTVLLEEVHDRAERELSEKDRDGACFYWVNACVTYIKQDDRTVYMACPSCNKKVNQESDTSWSCENC